MFSNIDEALDFVTNRPRGELKFDAFKEICNKLNNPEDSFRFIHVTGTNGKGSTITFLRDFLMAHGFVVGTLQSPHFITHLDRIRVNNVNIDSNYFLDKVNDNYDFYIENNIGMFEIDYLIAMDYFKYMNVDYVICEVGIGGRLDSTNVVNNTALSIITSISYDHTELLGDTLEKICNEKCGIIKNNSHVLVSNINDNLKDIVKSKALATKSKYHVLKDIIIKDNMSFSYDNNDYLLKTCAKYQIDNACLAIEALNILSNIYEFNIDINKVKVCVYNFIWLGRYSIINDNPKIIIDGAHNEEGIRRLVESFDNENGKKLIIFSALKRKDFHVMMNILKDHADKFIITRFDYPCSISKEDIDNQYEFVGDYRKYINKHKEYDTILICGSLYFISDVVSKLKIYR